MLISPPTSLALLWTLSSPTFPKEQLAAVAHEQWAPQIIMPYSAGLT